MLDICEKVELVLSDTLIESGETTRHVYFPTAGFISLITPANGIPALEVGMVGDEGMLGTQVLLGATISPLTALVQGPRVAWRARASDFKRQLQQSRLLIRDLHLYTHVCMLQMASMSACVRYHAIGPRLARWLLMMHDRAYSDTFYVTHEFLAFMLGVRRVGITQAAVGLKKLGLIKYRRGQISVLSRGGLEAAACNCYESDRRSYATFLHSSSAR